MDTMAALQEALPPLPSVASEAPSKGSLSRKLSAQATEFPAPRPDVQRYVPPSHRDRGAPRHPPSKPTSNASRASDHSRCPLGPSSVPQQQSQASPLFHCGACDRDFSTQRALEQHSQAKHGKQKEQGQQQQQQQQRRVWIDREDGKENAPRASSDGHPGLSKHAEQVQAPRQQQQQQLQQQKHKQKASTARKPKNTTCFKPSHAPPQLRVLCGPQTGRYPRAHGVHDVVLVPEFFCKEDDSALYDLLLKELKESGKEEEGLWALWHGDSHVIANDHKGWKKLCPTFKAIVDQMAEYFQMDVKATRLNWYRDSSEWKPFHHDRAAFTPGCNQNCTVGASFGLCRDVAFQHAQSSSVVCSFPQPNGSMYTFGRDVNVDWKHGVTQLPPESHVVRGRISIIAWGWVPEE